MIVFHQFVAVWIALTLAVGGVRGTTSPPSSAVVDEPSRMTDIPMGITREALLEQALGLQRNQEFDAAAAMYVSLLEVSVKLLYTVYCMFVQTISEKKGAPLSSY